jgi:hypothetical protein
MQTVYYPSRINATCINVNMEDIKSVLLQSFIMNIVTGIMCLLTMILSCFTFFGDRAERKQFQRQQQVVAPV